VLMFGVLSIFSVQAQQTLSFDEALNMMLESNKVISGASVVSMRRIVSIGLPKEAICHRWS
jgi:hypothetical protein